MARGKKVNMDGSKIEDDFTITMKDIKEAALKVGKEPALDGPSDAQQQARSEFLFLAGCAMSGLIAKGIAVSPDRLCSMALEYATEMQRLIK